MWGHFVKLESPDKTSQVAFLVTDKHKMHSISAVLDKFTLMRRFQSWNLLEFRVEEAQAEIEMIDTIEV